MPAAKYLARVGGRIQQVFATVVGGTGDQAGAIVALDDTGHLDTSIMPVSLGDNTFTGTASGDLIAGDFVAITSTGIARASAASGGVSADGFVLEASTNGTSATIYFEGRNTKLTGLTVGARYYLSDTAPGGITTAPVSGAGKLHQYLGKAITATMLAVKADDAIVLA